MSSAPQVTPAALLEPALGHVRVWYHKQLAPEIIDCFDFPHHDGMTVRELRELVAVRTNCPLLLLALTRDEALLPLDSLVSLDGFISLCVGPFTPTETLGPFLDQRAAFLLNLSELLDSFVNHCLIISFSIPIEHLQWRRIEALRQEGTVAPLMQLVRRVYRAEGLSGFYRGGLVLACGFGFGSAVATFIRTLNATFKPRIPLAVVDSFVRTLQCASAVLTYAIGLPITRATVAHNRKWGFAASFTWLLSREELLRSLRWLGPSIPSIFAIELVSSMVNDMSDTDDGLIAQWWARNIYKPSSDLGRLPLIVLGSTMVHPLFTLSRFIAANCPQKSATDSTFEFIEGGHVWSLLPDSIFMQVWAYAAISIASGAYSRLIDHRLLVLGRRKGATDGQIVQRLFLEAVLRVAASACGIAALFWFGRGSVLDAPHTEQHI